MPLLRHYIEYTCLYIHCQYIELERERVSQAVFARHLNVSAGLISQWERGEKRPAGASLKLLTLIQKKGLEAIA